MNEEERFMHFVAVFVQHASTIDQVKGQIVQDAYKARQVVPRDDEPMVHAYNFVSFKLSGANRPPWLPRL